MVNSDIHCFGVLPRGPDGLFAKSAVFSSYSWGLLRRAFNLFVLPTNHDDCTRKLLKICISTLDGGSRVRRWKGSLDIDIHWLYLNIRSVGYYLSAAIWCDFPCYIFHQVPPWVAVLC